MDIKKLFEDDGAVSPVIGVILMVAITVILAAVIASFVLGLGEETQTAQPQASFSFDYDRDTSGHDELTVYHEGGDTVEADYVNATVRSADASSSDPVFGPPTGSGDDGNLFGDSGDVTAGSSHLIDGGDFHDGSGNSISVLDLSEATVNVVYDDPSTDSTAVLATWEGPES